MKGRGGGSANGEIEMGKGRGVVGGVGLESGGWVGVRVGKGGLG